MIRTLITRLATISLALIVVRASAEEPPKLSAFDFLLGEWQGELIYLDYQDDQTRVTLPTWMTCSRSKGGESLRLEYRYSEPDGSKVDGFEMIRSSNRPETLFYDGLWTVEEVGSAVDGSLERIVLAAEGSDNDRAASIRKTLLRDGDMVRIRKEVRYGGAEEFFLRSETLLEPREPR